MAHLKKEQYDYRRESAAKRFEKSAEIGQANGLTEGQAEAIGRLQSLRHELHCNMDKIVHSNSEAYKSITETNQALVSSGLPRLEFAPLDIADSELYIDDFDVLYETEIIPEDDDERNEWYASHYDRIYDEWEEFNSKIENYLRQIDEKYKTSFCPSGALRIF